MQLLYHKDHTEKQLIYKTRPEVRSDGAEMTLAGRSFHSQSYFDSNLGYR